MKPSLFLCHKFQSIILCNFKYTLVYNSYESFTIQKRSGYSTKSHKAMLYTSAVFLSKWRYFDALCNTYILCPVIYAASTQNVPAKKPAFHFINSAAAILPPLPRWFSKQGFSEHIVYAAVP